MIEAVVVLLLALNIQAAAIYLKLSEFVENCEVDTGIDAIEDRVPVVDAFGEARRRLDFALGLNPKDEGDEEDPGGDPGGWVI